MTLDDLLSGSFAELAEFLMASTSIPMVLLNRDLCIEDCNQAFLDTMALNRTPVNVPFEEFIEDPSSHVGHLLTGKGRLTLKKGDSLTQTMDFRTLEISGHHLVIGERILITESDAVRQIAGMHEELVNLNRELVRKNHQLEEARSRIKVLGGLLPICMYCKNIRNDDGYWAQLEEYIDEHSEAQFSHSICPDCMKEHFPEMWKEKERN